MRRLPPALSTTIIGVFSAVSCLAAACSSSSGDPTASDAGSMATSSGSPGTSGSPSTSGNPSNGDSGTSGTTDSGTSGTSGSSGSVQPEAGTDGGGTCNSLTQQGLNHDIVTSAAALPTGAGGALTAGTWLRTAEIVHDPSGAGGQNLGNAGASTWVFSGNDLEIVNTNASGAVDHRSLTFTVAGGQLNLTSVCISPPPMSTPANPAATFTADATSLKVYLSSSGGAAGGGIEFDFTKK
ncbi:MAG: hypothetical protein JWO86_1609 [Myxococcaceae bacterium]|jgi:hypothetical protein|nr:hypothetical protein [Myxococcaceae bacterium]MEA2746602.1 hypothetical protein [Myxococcales bacterium]